MILLLILLNTTLQAGAVFLMIAPGSGQVGMGMGGVAYPHDIPGIYYNPAHISHVPAGIYIQNTHLGLPWNTVYSEILSRYYNKDIPLSPDWLPSLYPGMKYTYGGIKFPAYKMIHWGLNYTLMITGKSETTFNDTYYSWYSYDYAIGATIGTSFFLDIINIGLTAKYVYSFLAPKRLLEDMGYSDIRGYARTFTYDAGILLKDPYDISSFGISYSNIIGSLRYSTSTYSQADPLPKVIRYGFSFSPVAAADCLLGKFFSSPRDILNLFNMRYTKEILTDRIGEEHDFWNSSGWEYRLFNTIYFREGVFSDTLGRRVGKTYGLGLRIGNITLDYADDSDIYAFRERNNYRVSLNVDLMENENRIFALPLSLIYPGAGHLYIGNQKGLIYGGLATFVSLLYPFEDNTKTVIYSSLFYSLIALSLADLIYFEF
ncbi:hypothetical protein KAW48_02640 [candidate division WOR-3 bacterium]|nr:hypothetical protein [candidate division WOR-3 bacterium]